MAAHAPSSDLIVSSERSTPMALAANSMDYQTDRSLGSSLGTTEKLAVMTQQLVGAIESRVLDAFRQATGDVISHLTKETASRVVLAERKAARFEQELVHVKQQALAMLLHQKQSSDFQVSEVKCKYMHERKRAEDAEGKVSTLEETVKRLQGELKKNGNLLESLKKISGQSLIKTASLVHGEGFRDVNSLVLFAGVTSEDARNLSNSAMQKLPLGISKTQSKLQASSSISPACEMAGNTTAETSLRPSEEHVQCCNNARITEIDNPTILAHEQQKLTDLDSVFCPSSKENSSQLLKMEAPKGVVHDHMPVASKLVVAKTKPILKHCLTDLKPPCDGNMKEVDNPQIHSSGVQSPTACSALKSGRTDIDSVCTFEVRETENQANESSSFVRPLPFSMRINPSYSSANEMVVSRDYPKNGLQIRGSQTPASIISEFKAEYKYPGTGSLTDGAQNGIRQIDNKSLPVESSSQLLKGLFPGNAEEQKSDCADESGGCYQRCLPKSTVQVAETPLAIKALIPDKSETIEVQEALQCLSKGVEDPGSNDVPFKSLVDSLVDGLAVSSSQDRDVGSHSEVAVLGDSRKTDDQVDIEYCEQNDKTDSPELLPTSEQVNSHSKTVKKRKVGPKGSSPNNVTSLERISFKKPRAPKSSIQPTNNHAARADSIQGSCEGKKPAILAVESSRDSRRLMQGARQLFLLAERKWH